MQNPGRVEGLAEFEAQLNELARVIGIDALREAEDTAAEAIVRVIEAATPKETGILAGSIEVIERKNRRALTRTSRALLIGPNKEQGYYGFWIDKGWKHPVGRRETKYTRKGRKFVTGRRARPNGWTHSQQGVKGVKRISGTKWFSRLSPSLISVGKSAGMTVLLRYAKRYSK